MVPHRERAIKEDGGHPSIEVINAVIIAPINQVKGIHGVTNNRQIRPRGPSMLHKLNLKLGACLMDIEFDYIPARILLAVRQGPIRGVAKLIVGSIDNGILLNLIVLFFYQVLTPTKVLVIENIERQQVIGQASLSRHVIETELVTVALMLNLGEPSLHDSIQQFIVPASYHHSRLD